MEPWEDSEWETKQNDQKIGELTNEEQFNNPYNEDDAIKWEILTTYTISKGNLFGLIYILPFIVIL